MSSFPPEIITNILIHLPVKSLLRFRCVSKPWCCLIDSPHFINLHLSHSITTNSNLFPITESEGTLYTLNSNSLVKIETPFINPQNCSLSFTCNGLLLLHNQWDSESFILYNPSTRKHRVLPAPPPNNNYADLTSYQGFSSLGYDVINDDYKVFNVLEFVDRDNDFINNFITSEARIYSLKSNLWHVVKDFTKEVVFDFVFEAYVNGALHAVNVKDRTSIVALDVGKESFKFIPMPDFEDKCFSYFVVDVFDGCLTVLCLYSDNRTDIWVMKEYGVKESWSMIFSGKLKPEDPLVLLDIMSLAYPQNHAELLLSCDCEQLVWYDLRNKTFRDFKDSGLTRFGRVCVESLVSVGTTGKTDEKEQHGEEK